MRRLFKGILILVMPVLLLAGLNIFIDPYFHFHKPVKGISYILENERYQNDGILRNFDYDTIITGTSLDQNEKTTEVEKLFGGKAVKVPFAGGYFPELSFTLDNALKRKNVKRIIMSLGYSSYIEAEPDDWGHPEFNYPTYLYDNNIFNDVKYIFDISALNMWLRDLVRTIRGIKSTSFDEYSNWQSREIFGKESVLEKYYKDRRTHRERLIDIKITRENIRKNLVELANKYPNTEFDFYLPPFNIIFWYDLQQNNELYDKINGIKAVIEELLPCKNVNIYYFINEWKIVTNFENYKDIVHYDKWVNSYMLNKIKNNKNLLTKDNYEDYLNKTKEFYENYNYEPLFN